MHVITHTCSQCHRSSVTDVSLQALHENKAPTAPGQLAMLESTCPASLGRLEDYQFMGALRTP